MKVAEKPEYVNLSPDQVTFCHHYVATGGDWEAAYDKTGLKAKRRDDKRRSVRRWFEQPAFNDYIKELHQMAAKKAAIDAAEVLDAFLNIREAAFNCGDFGNANKANEHLARTLGLFIDKAEQKITHVQSSGSEEDIDAQIKQLTDLLGDNRSIN